MRFQAASVSVVIDNREGYTFLNFKERPRIFSKKSHVCCKQKIYQFSFPHIEGIEYVGQFNYISQRKSLDTITTRSVVILKSQMRTSKFELNLQPHAAIFCGHFLLLPEVVLTKKNQTDWNS